MRDARCPVRVTLLAAVLVVAACIIPSQLSATSAAPPAVCGHADIKGVKPHPEGAANIQSVSDEPEMCGCAALEYPDYTIQTGDFDPETGEYIPETATVQGLTTYTSYFAIHYPASYERTDEESSSTIVTECRWDWALEEAKDFGSSNFLVDCSMEETVALNAATILDSTWSRELGMGYPTPPMPNGRIDVYVGDLAALLGAPYQGAVEACAENQGGGASASRIFLDRTLTDPEILEEVVAHELFHVVQNGIDHKEGLAWMESSAMWMQGEITGRWDWGYQEYANEHPELALTDQNPWQLKFGNMVWPAFLADRYGPEIVRDIWLEANNVGMGDDGMLMAYNRLNAGLDGYAAGIHLFRYHQWRDLGAPESARISLSRRSPEATGEHVLKDTAGMFILFVGDPKEPDGKFNLCFENLDAKAGLWAKAAMLETSSGDDPPDDVEEATEKTAADASATDKDGVYEVSLDEDDAECLGGASLEVDGFGTAVPWVLLTVSFAGDPASGDLCSGHGAYAACGHKGYDPPCGEAGFQYSVLVDYPEETGGCAVLSDAGSSDRGQAWLVLICLLSVPLGFRLRRSRGGRTTSG